MERRNLPYADGEIIRQLLRPARRQVQELTLPERAYATQRDSPYLLKSLSLRRLSPLGIWSGAEPFGVLDSLLTHKSHYLGGAACALVSPFVCD